MKILLNMLRDDRFDLHDLEIRAGVHCAGCEMHVETNAMETEQAKPGVGPAKDDYTATGGLSNVVVNLRGEAVISNRRFVRSNAVFLRFARHSFSFDSYSINRPAGMWARGLASAPWRALLRPGRSVTLLTRPRVEI